MVGNQRWGVAIVGQRTTFSQGSDTPTTVCGCAALIQAIASLFSSDSSIASFDTVCLNMGPDSAVILAGVSHLDAQYLPVHQSWAICLDGAPCSEHSKWNRCVLWTRTKLKNNTEAYGARRDS